MLTGGGKLVVQNQLSQPHDPETEKTYLCHTSCYLAARWLGDLRTLALAYLSNLCRCHPVTFLPKTDGVRFEIKTEIAGFRRHIYQLLIPP